MREPLPGLQVDPVRPMDTVVQQDWHFLQSVAKPWLVKQRVPERMLEDILQTAWMHLYQARGRRPDMQLDYAFSCVKYARTDMWRKERHYVFPDEILGTWDADHTAADLLEALAYAQAQRQGWASASPEDTVIARDLSAKLRAVCARLGAQDKTYLMILMRYCEEAPPAQIARALGVTRQTVYNRTGPAALECLLDAVRQVLLPLPYPVDNGGGTAGHDA